MAQIYALHFEGEYGVYIGCTRSGIAKRLREHRSLLKSGRHTCRELQRRFDDRNGELRIYVISECADDLPNRRAAELAEMDKAGSALINDRFSFQPSLDAIRKGIANAHRAPGNRWTAEANEKRRIAQIGKPKGHGAKISATKRARRISGDEIV